jgi:hypothetical protein
VFFGNFSRKDPNGTIIGHCGKFSTVGVKTLTPRKKKPYQSDTDISDRPRLWEKSKEMFRGFIAVNRLRIWFVATY